MKNLIVASEYRKLKLLQMLFNAPQNYQKKQLASLLHCSIKTLESDIESLQGLIDKDIAYVYENEARYIMLDVGEHVNFAYLYALIISNSHLYLLADDTLRSAEMNLSEWAEQNYSSVPTMYRRIRQIDDYLSECNLVLETQPLAIKGPEVNLRFFYYHIYSKAYPYTEWQFPDIPYETLNQFIIQIEAFYHIRFSLSSRIKYAISLAVALTRIKQDSAFISKKHYLDCWDNITADQPDGATIDYTLLEDIIGCPLSKDERFFTIIMASWSHFTHTSSYFSKARAKHGPNVYAPNHMLASELTGILNQHHTPNTELAITETIDFLFRFTFLDKMNFLPDIPRPQNSPEEIQLRDQIRKILTKYETHTDFRYIRSNKPLIINHLVDIYSILMKQTPPYDTLHIKVISENGHLWEEYLRSEIKKKYSKDQVRLCHDTISHQPKPHIDLIISDFPFYEQPDIEADGLLWNIPPSPTDFAQLDMVLERQKVY
ncbi:hypothetical protein HB943_09710 [Listeria weihenstephanensis]|uniref:Mga helix-turn-helix domain-containing protein n=1 Tax=Listeria weihenstephanensis TaxID=1006155 RepID=A0A841Z8B5_9LIST|nr:helix-turn-helix domain-containing protein [Listeria weihenstephanensis]MBC1500882.1 hypothetical protein [Listeria weihenstephanensis]